MDDQGSIPGSGMIFLFSMAFRPALRTITISLGRKEAED
jgi:hypothetical protein